MTSIVVVDPCELERRSLAAGLRKLGVVCIEAVDAAELAGVIARLPKPPDLCLTALRLCDRTRLDGLELVRSLQPPKWPCAIVTKYASRAAWEAAAQAGALALFEKPADPERIVALALRPERLGYTVAPSEAALRHERDHVFATFLKHKGNVTATARALEWPVARTRRRLMCPLYGPVPNDDTSPLQGPALNAMPANAQDEKSRTGSKRSPGSL